jgi:hypothetical protein
MVSGSAPGSKSGGARNDIFAQTDGATTCPPKQQLSEPRRAERHLEGVTGRHGGLAMIDEAEAGGCVVNIY